MWIFTVWKLSLCWIIFRISVFLTQLKCKTEALVEGMSAKTGWCTMVVREGNYEGEKVSAIKMFIEGGCVFIYFQGPHCCRQGKAFLVLVGFLEEDGALSVLICNSVHHHHPSQRKKKGLCERAVILGVWPSSFLVPGPSVSAVQKDTQLAQWAAAQGRLLGTVLHKRRLFPLLSPTWVFPLIENP